MCGGGGGADTDDIGADEATQVLHDKYEVECLLEIDRGRPGC